MSDEYDFSQSPSPPQSQVVSQGAVAPTPGRGIRPIDHAKYREQPRVVVVGSISYNHPEQPEPTVVEIRSCRFLKLPGEQPFVRHGSVGEDWQPFDIGWLKGTGLLVIKNAEGLRPHYHPTEAEKEAVSHRVILIGLKVPPSASDGSTHPPQDTTSDGYRIYPFLKVRPGETQPLEPTDLGSLVYCCERGQARYTLTAIPE